MIVRMSKIEIIGPKGLLQDTLSLLRELGVFQIEPATVGFIEKGHEEHIRSFSPDEKTLVERFFLEDLRQNISSLFSYLPHVPVRRCYFEPLSIIDIITKTIQKHLSNAREMSERRDSLQKELSDLLRYKTFLNALSSLSGNARETPDLDFIGLSIKDPSLVTHLREAIARITNGKYELLTRTAGDGTLVGLIVIEEQISDKVKKSLSDERVPELTFPPSFNGLSFPEKITRLKKRIDEISHEMSIIESDLSQFSRRWIPIYQCVMDWIENRLILLSATASAFETRMCFFIYGWMSTGDLERLRKKITDAFGKQVVIEEKDIREEDMDRIPVILRNPAYFRPFELFTRFLPLPAYSSFDPTPFMGIFFPIFFGMILGDAGYGLFLSVLSFVMISVFRRRKLVQDAARILFISSLYSVFFGILFGEFFGDLPQRLFELEPICIERRTAIIPMICFALTVGVVHVILGLCMGAITSFRKKTKREAAYRLLSIFTLLCLLAVFASFFGIFPALLTRPIIIAILVLTPFLFFTGGLLAPLEFLKSIGNIISYVRIMAIGLTSVLLAFVANRLAGLTGDIVIGVVVAGLIHLLNIILGVFSPTIHSLRLHYVEFFSKFIEPGGRKFEPLQKEGFKNNIQ